MSAAPEDPAALAREALARHEAGHLEEARELYLELLTSQPREAWVHNNLGHVLHQLRRLTEAEACYKRAIELDQDLGDAQWNLCSLQLLRGEFEHAWPRFHYRHAVSRLPRRPQTRPLWQGEPLAGKTILLHKEYGFGDTIQFARYVPLVAARGGQVVLEVQAEVMRLFQALDGVDVLLRRGSEPPPFDFQCGLMELPRVFNTTVTTIPAVPYLAANRVLETAWQKRLPRGFKVGLVWSGNPNFPDAEYKCIPFDLLKPLFTVAGVTWISLQTGAAARGLTDLRDTTIDVAPLLHDFADTAAAIANLDLVITVDTAVAHLAGALGKRVWLLLPFVPDWRWLLETDECPWYPSMRIFRQTERMSWAPVIERVAAELHASVKPPAAAGVMSRLKRHLTWSAR